MRVLPKLGCLCCLCVVWATVDVASAVDVRVTVRNLSPGGSVALSPFTLAAHDGTFDAFDAGATAGMGIENIAELGDGSALVSEAASAQPSAVTGTAIATTGGFGPGIFLPGASGSVVLSLDPARHRFLSYGAMVVPSNDAFLGNDSPTGVELFNASGNFVGSELILTGNQIWDAGTEVNQLLGAAYVVGQNAMQGMDENGVVHLADLSTQFSSYLGSDAPSGDTFTVTPLDNTPIASLSFQVVPEPSTWALVGLGFVALGLVGRRSRHETLGN